jgi:hypothetical protein
MDLVILMILSSLKYRDILDYTSAQLKKLKWHVIHEILIGSLEKSEMDTFRDGFNIRISNDIPNISLVR